MSSRIVKEGLTFDDVLLIPQASDVVPADVDLRTKLTDDICLNVPWSAPRWIPSPKTEWPLRLRGKGAGDHSQKHDDRAAGRTGG